MQLFMDEDQLSEKHSQEKLADEKEMSAIEKAIYLPYLGMYATNNTTIWGQYDNLVDFIFDS
jgi:hypothetical protein